MIDALQIQGWIKLATSPQHRGYVLAGALVKLGNENLQLRKTISRLQRQLSFNRKAKEVGGG